MILLQRWTLLLIVPAIMLASCSSDSSDNTDLVGDWMSLYSFNGTARSEAVSFTIGNKSYVGTGINDLQKKLADFWEFDAVSGLWRRVKQFPGIARSGAIAFSVGGKGYVGTGVDENDNRLNDFYEYTPGTLPTDSGSWVRINDFAGTPRLDATGFAIGSKGYLLTGYDGSDLKDFWEFTPNTGVDNKGAWVEKPFPGNKRRNGVTFTIGTSVYFATGTNNGLPTNDFWMFDQTNGWSKKRELTNISTDSYDDDYTSITRTNAAAFVINSKGFICTGENGSSPNDCWQYDPSNDTWLKKTTFEGLGRTGAIGLTVNGNGYIMTGRSGNSPFDDIWKFAPDAEQVDNN